MSLASITLVNKKDVSPLMSFWIHGRAEAIHDLNIDGQFPPLRSELVVATGEMSDAVEVKIGLPPDLLVAGRDRWQRRDPVRTLAGVIQSIATGLSCHQ